MAKDRHKKRRLIILDKLKIIKILKDGLEIWFKTDDDHYLMNLRIL